MIDEHVRSVVRDYALRVNAAVERAKELGQGVLVLWSGVDFTVEVTPDVPAGHLIERRVNA